MKGVLRIAAGVLCAAFCRQAGLAGEPDGRDLRRWLDVPAGYADFKREVKVTARYGYPDFDVECLEQRNGPDSVQRVMMAVPRDVGKKCPAVVAPFYFPEAMLGFDPKTGSLASPLAPANTNLSFYSEIAYLSDLARRGYIAISADAYHLSSVKGDLPAGSFSRWRAAGTALKRDWPQWTGIGKLAFDTRLLVDLLCADRRVDASRIGIIGHSLGGKMAFYAGCLDPRIRVIVASDFGIGWDQTNWKDVWYWGEALDEVRARGHDNSELLASAGGKPICLIAGKYDNAASGELIRRVRWYADDPSKFLFVNHATGHRPPRWATEKGYEFLDRALRAVTVVDSASFGREENPALRVEKREDVQVVETAPLSEEWVCRGRGKSYNLFSWRPKGWRPNADYTLVVRARSFAGENAFSALVMKMRPGGKVVEGYYPASGVMLGSGMREYRFPFRTDSCQPHAINFYKARPTDPDKGVDISSVKLLEGKQNNLEVLPIYRGGRGVRGGGKMPVPGTGVGMRPNPYGRSRQGIRALAVGYDSRSIRTVQEAFAGLNAELDVIVGPSYGALELAGAEDFDLFYSDGDPDRILGRLERGDYGLYVILNRAAPLIGEKLAARIVANVEKGAGLVAYRNGKWGRLSDIVAEAGRAAWTTDGDFPYAPAVATKTGAFGRGRVLLVDADEAKLRPPADDCGISDFPYSRFADMWMARTFYRAAGCASETNATASVRWIVSSRDGAGRSEGTAPSVSEAVVRAREAVTTSGRHVVSLRSVDAQGLTTGCTFETFERDGPALKDFRAIADSVSGDASAQFAVVVDAQGADVSATWTLEDFSGRCLERGSVVSGVAFEVPVRALYTNLGILRLRLHEGRVLRDSLVAPVIARDRDAARTLNDFTVGIWPAGTLLSKDGTDGEERLFEEIGIRHSLLQLSWAPYLSLCHGLAVGGRPVGSYGMFGPQAQPSNVRVRGPFNTAAGRAAFVKDAKCAASSAARYGVVGASVCDEPDLVEHRAETEPDEQPENVAEYRRRMETKYRTVSEFNRRHGTSYGAFGDVAPAHLADARATGRFGEYVEWRNFNVDRWCEAIRLVADTAKAEDPTMRLSLYNSFGQTAASGNDYWKLLTRAGLDISQEYTEMTAFGNRPIANFDEFYRSFRPDMRLWGFIGYGMSPERIRFAPWWFAAHRYGGLTWFSAWTWEYQLFDMPTLAFTKDAMALRDSLSGSGLLDGLGALMLAYPWAKREIALYYSHESLLVSTALGTETRSFEIAESGPLHDYMFSRQGIVRTVEGLLYQHDFIAPEQVAAGRLGNYRIVFLPRIVALSDAEVAALKAFAARGGRIVADAMPGAYDELGMRRLQPPFAPDEITVLGENFDERRPESRARVAAILRESKIRPVLACAGADELTGREAMHFTDGTNSLYVVLRMTDRSKDDTTQTFAFVNEGHVYDVRTGRFLGRRGGVSAAVPLSDAACWSVCAGRAAGFAIDVPGEVVCGTDIRAALRLGTVEGPAGTRLFRIRMVRPDGTSRFHLERKVLAPDGKAEFAFRVAFNDPVGTWRLQVKDVLTGLSAERAVEVR